MTLTRGPLHRAGTAGRTLAALGALTALLPLDVLVAAGAAATGVASRGREPSRRPGSGGRTVLLTGGKMTKALHLARAFHRAGHRVVLVEQRRYRWTAHRFSRCVDAFHVVPGADETGYAEALLDLVRRERVDVLVPVCSPVSSVPDAEARSLLDPWCEVVHPAAAHVRRVDDKHAFAALARSLGLSVPDTHRVTGPAEAVELAHRLGGPGRPAYVLKSIAYDPVRRLDLTPLPRPTREQTAAFVAGLPIDEHRPWILQELVEGTEYCTHGTVRSGRLRAYTCCRSSPFQLTYEPVEHPGVRAWVEQFVRGTGLTGQLSFDLVERPDGTITAIECNPRPHSAVTLFRDAGALASAYLDDDPAHGPTTVEPAPGTRTTYWLHHQLWQALQDPRAARRHLGVLLHGRDAVLDPADPLPFLALWHLHLPSLLLDALVHGRSWLRLDPNIGKLVQAAGD